MRNHKSNRFIMTVLMVGAPLITAAYEDDEKEGHDDTDTLGDTDGDTDG